MKKHVRKSLSLRLPLLFVASVLVITLVTVPLVYRQFYNRMVDQYTRMAQGVTQLVVNAFDGDKVEEYMEKNVTLQEYRDLVDYLYTLRDNYPDILYLYIYRFEEDGGHVVIDLDAQWWENGEGYDPGYHWSLDVIEEPFASRLSEIMAGKEIAGYLEQTKEDGYLFTYTRPIFRSDGTYACTACVDFSMDYLSGMDIAFTLRLTLMLLGAGALVLILIFIIVRRRITQPIDELSRCAGMFAYDTEEDRKNNLALLDKLDIHTGDEIEDVYHMLRRVTHDSFQASATLSRAQMDIKGRDGMITAMAADYRSIFFADLDKDECICIRAAVKSYDAQMYLGKPFSFREGFLEYAEKFVAEEDREAFLRFIDPDNIRSELAHEAMISLRYLAVKDGAEVYEMLRFAGVRLIEERDDHMVHGIAAGFSDIDRQAREEMEKNRALSEALARAEEANRAKTAFLSSMSHEIRTPMNAIIGLDNIALRDPDISAHTRDELEKIGSSAKHLLALINDILDMSRIESGRMELKAEEFSFQEMAEQVNIIIQGQCNDKGLSYESHMDGLGDERFIGDPLRLRQIIINILGNAVKFTDPPGHVTFTVKQTAQDSTGRMLHLTMADTGVGMDKDFIPKLFEPFAQEDATTTNRYGGSGLGMAITRNIVTLMKGEIHVSSEKGRGTVFTVDIPLKMAETVRTSDDAPSPAPVSSVDGMHVLIAEDQEMNADILTELLEMEGVTSEWAVNGQAALDMFSGSEDGHFDAILMDMRMPVMDGLDATRRIRALARPDAAGIPIIALTANAFEEDVKLCLEAGMNAHLSKPVDIDKVKEILGRLAGRAKS